MKKHFASLFDATHLKKTIYLFIISAVLIIVSSCVGVSDNLPMIAMLLAGIMLLIYAMVHPWKKAMNYTILALVCIGILLLEWLIIIILDKIDKTELISEGLAMGLTFLVCVPGLMVGITGAIFYAIRKK